MTAIAADCEVGADFLWAVRCVATNALDKSVFFDEAGRLPSQAQGKARVTGRFLGEKVQQVPLRHEGDELRVGGQMREVADLEFITSDHCGDVVDFRMPDFKQLLEQAELIHQLQRGGMDRVAAKIAEEVF